MSTIRAFFSPASVAALGVIAVLLAYLPAINAGFVSDDEQYILNNDALRQLPLWQFWRFLSERTNPMEFLPLRDFSYRIDMALFNVQPLGYHLHNLLLYALCCLTLWFCARDLARLFRPERESSRHQWFATLATLLFAAHPAHVEAVAWVAGRKDVLAGLFALLALQQFTAAISPARVRRLHLFLATLCFALALLAKSTVLPFAPVMLLVAAMRYSQTMPWLAAARHAMLVTLPIAVAACGGLALHLMVGGNTGIRLVPGIDPAEMFEHVYTRALAILGGHADVALAPVNLRLTYDLSQTGLHQTRLYLLGTLALLGAGAGLWLALKKHSLAGLGMTLFVITLLPVLQLIPFATWSLVSERFLFLPVLGLAIALGAGLACVKQPLRIALAALLILAGIGLTAYRALDWQSPEQIMRKNAEASPDYYYAQYLYIPYLLAARRDDLALQLAARVSNPKAREYLTLNTRLAGVFDLIPSQISPSEAGRVLEQMSLRYAERPERELLAYIPFPRMLGMLIDNVTSGFQNLLMLQPGNLELHFRLAAHYLRHRHTAEAVAILRMVVENQGAPPPLRAEAWRTLGIAQSKLHQEEQALQSYTAALAADPQHWRAAYNLADLYRARGDTARTQQLLAEGTARAAAQDIGAADAEKSAHADPQRSW